ncbi:MAG: acylphosphatase [Methanosarcinales archaeon]|jgi:acylphosphatase|nr:acylphosphatase [Methanosarcinales archaeon]
MKLKFILKGKKVHEVGYRVLLLNKAMSLGVDNFNTFNTFIDGVQIVIAIIDTDIESIEEFKGFVNTTTPEGAKLDEISVDEYTNTVPPIERCMQAFQMEHWGKSIPILLKMLDNQDQTITTIKDEGDKTRDAISDHMSQDIVELRDEISHMKTTMAKIASKVGVAV